MSAVTIRCRFPREDTTLPNRSHRNAGHRTMNRLRRDDRPHASERDLPEKPERTHHRLALADVLEGLATVSSGSARLVIADPPYNLELAGWDRFDHYVEWAAQWLTECERVLSPDGSLVIFGGLQYQQAKGGDLLEIMHHLRRQSTLRLVNLIVWNYPNGMSAHRFFANRHEEIAWYAKGKNYLFDLDAVREPYDEATKARYLRDKRLRPETIEKGKNPTNVWSIGRLNGNSKERTGHPTQKPRAVIERLMLALSHPGDLVVDPFAGSGVTARVAIEQSRHSVSIDRDPALASHLELQLRDLSDGILPFDLEEASSRPILDGSKTSRQGDRNGSCDR